MKKSITIRVTVVEKPFIESASREELKNIIEEVVKSSQVGKSPAVRFSSIESTPFVSMKRS